MRGIYHALMTGSLTVDIHRQYSCSLERHPNGTMAVLRNLIIYLQYTIYLNNILILIYFQYIYLFKILYLIYILNIFL